MAYNDAQRRGHVNEVQRYLYGISYYNEKIPRIIPDGIYGKETKIAVSAFQQEYGLPVTGEVNRATWEKLVRVYKSLVSNEPETLDIFPSKSYVIKQGDRGYLVTLLQVMLNALSENCSSCSKIPVNGFFDTATVKAVKGFQALTKQPQTGIIDIAAWNILAKAFNYMAK